MTTPKDSTAEGLATLLDSETTPAVVRETLYRYTVQPLWFEYVDELKPRMPKPLAGKTLGAWVRLHLPVLLTRAAADDLHVAGVPTHPTMVRQRKAAAPARG